MLALKYLLMILGIGLFGSASALVVYDIFLSGQLRRLLSWRTKSESRAKSYGAQEGVKKRAQARVDFAQAKAWAAGLR